MRNQRHAYMRVIDYSSILASEPIGNRHNVDPSAHGNNETDEFDDVRSLLRDRFQF